MKKMKKYLDHFIVCIALAVIPGCSDVLDIENIYGYDSDLVWDDENLANAYITNLYANVFGNWYTQHDKQSHQLAGIYWYADRVTTTNGEFQNWNFSLIRLINTAIVKVKEGSLSDEVKDEITAQALFMRAYVYFNMVVYHGGVPYIKIPQVQDEDDLYVARNSTAECFAYMIEDLDDAIELLPRNISSTSDDYGHIDGNFALAFKAKVLLYKASPQFNPSRPWDNEYWSEAYTVNKEAYNSLKNQGYALEPDYSEIFSNEGGPEVVFAVINSYPNKTANWDLGARPGSVSRDVAYACPTWEFIKEIPMKDGKLYNDPTGSYYMSEHDFLQGYWNNRDPRFEKSILWNGSLYNVAGVASNYRQYTALGVVDPLDDFGINPNAGTTCGNMRYYTGFFMMKACNLSLTQAEVQQYDYDYLVMRFAEVMLNYAETANEVGYFDDAFDILKQIRERAGILAGSDGNYGILAATKEELREAILAERNIEFCFEGKYFWDIRRLRMFEKLNGLTEHGVEAIAINADGTEMSILEAKTKASNYELTETDFKYSLVQIPLTGVQQHTLPDKYYFFPIQQSTINRNSNIEQNVDWGGTFNPALE